MSTPAGAAAYADGYLAEDDACGEARALGTAAGAHPISAAGGAALSVLAATISARAVVEIGTGAGVSGLYLLRGMADDGTLTTIDVDPELQRSARWTFLAAGYGPGRARLINGMALEVLPRLTDGGYDLVVADAVPAEYPGYLAEAIRLLRPGGCSCWRGCSTAAGSPSPVPSTVRTRPRCARPPPWSATTSACCRRCCRSRTGCSARSAGERSERGIDTAGSPPQWAVTPLPRTTTPPLETV